VLLANKTYNLNIHINISALKLNTKMKISHAKVTEINDHKTEDMIKHTIRMTYCPYPSANILVLFHVLLNASLLTYVKRIS
jgi:hypothetical protein